MRLAQAAALTNHLTGLDGFVSVERFESLSEPGKLLSLSYWRDETAVTSWRSHEAHRRAQSLGREQLLFDDRLRVAQVLRDYGLHARAQAPCDSRTHHEA